MTKRIRKARRDWLDTLERCAREAFRTQHWLPPDGTRPASYRSCMPAVVRERRVDYPDEKTVVRFAPTQAAISNLDFVLVTLASADLLEQQRHLVWERASGLSWKQLEWKHGIPRSTLRRIYSNALAEWCAYIIASRRSPPWRGPTRKMLAANANT